MAELRQSRARNEYTCSKCFRSIMRGEEYFRLEPFPFDRIKGIAKTQHLCAVCVLGQEEVDRITREKREAVKNHWTSMGSSSPVMIQQTLNLDDPITIVRASVEVIN